jgi:hypothetical protein
MSLAKLKRVHFVCIPAIVLAILSQIGCAGEREIEQSELKLATTPQHHIGVLRSLAGADTTGCSVIVVTSTQCGVSRALAVRWRDELSQSSRGIQIDTKWLVADSSSKSDRFVNTMKDVGKFELVADNSEELLSRLGVIGTPVTFVVDFERGRYLPIQGNFIPSHAQLIETCGKTSAQ